MNEELEKLKSLLYTDSLTQYGKRKLIKIYEDIIKKKDKQIDFIINFIYEVLCKYPGTISHALRRNGFNDNECGTCENTNKNCIKCLKLYFESKSKEEKQYENDSI